MTYDCLKLKGFFVMAKGILHKNAKTNIVNESLSNGSDDIFNVYNQPVVTGKVSQYETNVKTAHKNINVSLIKISCPSIYSKDVLKL